MTDRNDAWTMDGQGPQLPATVVDLVARAGATNPDDPALIFEDGLIVSRGELRRRAEGFAGYLDEVTSPGEMIAVMMDNRAEFMIAWIATMAAGCTLVAINPAAGEHDLAHILSDSGASMIICDGASSKRLDEMDSVLAGVGEKIVLADSEPGGLDAWQGAKPLSFDDVKIDPDQITNVYYTSGTTGPPKGCMVDHRYWRRIAGWYIAKHDYQPTDRLLCCLKFFYNDPSWQTLVSLHVGAPLIFMRKFSVSRFWQVARDNDVTQIFTIGSIPALLLSAAPSELDREHNVRLGVQVAIDASLHQEMTDRWGIPWTDVYGLTETGGLIGMPVEDAAEMTGSGSLGKPYADVEHRLVDEAGEDVPTGDPGELRVRVPDIMSGYLNRPEATAAAIDPEGWFSTGDLMRKDEAGWFYFVGRKKDIIRRAGENIAAGEVEEVLRGHPRIIDAAVVPVSDPLRGEEALAHIYAESAESPDQFAVEIAELCEQKLAPYKVPRYLRFRTDDFPRTASMRVAKPELAKLGLPDDALDRERAAG